VRLLLQAVHPVHRVPLGSAPPIAPEPPPRETLPTRTRCAAFAAVGVVTVWLAALVWPATALAQNAIVTENALTGAPSSQWDISGSGDGTIQGFATDISVNKGGTIHFKIKTPANAYHIDIYRLGYYQGNGARKVGTGVITASLPQTQPADLYDSSTGLTDCGNWAESAHWDVPSSAVSGLYIAKLIRNDTGGASHIAFVVRDDASHSDLIVKTSDCTWQAYNVYGGNSLYVGSTSYPSGHAAKVSFNRPFLTRAGGGGSGEAGQDWLFNAEYPMIRWIEANGYDITYTTDIDTDRNGSLLLNHKVFVSMGHDEYWSGGERTNVEAARTAGVHLAFFSGNEIYWKTRWENSTDGSNTPYRTLVCYKEGTLGENVCGGKCDPLTNVWTGLWRDGCAYTPPADGCRPENALSGEISWGDSQGAITVPSTYKNLRFWRNTSVASLGSGQTATLTNGALGYEFDWEQYASSAPIGRILMSNTSLVGKTHMLSLYRNPSGSLVFGAGTVQWSWGLDSHHDRQASTPSLAMQQATMNLFADMGAQPGSRQSGLVAATASTDATAPVSVITSPTQGASLPSGSPVTITGTASDVGGVVAGVDISVDGGTTWQPVTGTTSWTFSWTPSASGSVTIKTRGFDDTGNLEVAGTSPGPKVVVVNVTSAVCPCTVFPGSSAPGTPNNNDGQALEVGMRFRASQNGYIDGIRFYKGTSNTGTHTGELWTNTGTRLAQVVFTGESGSGWQQMLFPSHVAVTAGTTYVAAYHSAGGGYAADDLYFTGPIVRGPLTGLADGTDGANGVYRYTATPAFPNLSYQSSNYWVDVVYEPLPPDTTAPTVINRSPSPGSTGVAKNVAPSATFSEALDPTTVSGATVELDGPNEATVATTISYDSVAHVVTMTPASPLADSTIYSVLIRGGGIDPRIKDLSGNALAANVTWVFTTIGDRTPPTVQSTVPASGATGVSDTVVVAGFFSEPLDSNTVTTSTFELRGPGNVLIPATVRYDSTARAARLTPNAPLADSTVYTATLHGGTSGPRIKDLAGNPLAANVTWSFTTIGDRTPPTVLSTSPTAGATGVPDNAVVSGLFSEPLDSTTVTTATFELRGPGNTLIPATVRYDSTAHAARLTPNAPLADSTVYTATLHGGATDPRIKDLAGNPLAANVTWSFTTIGDRTPPTVLSTSPTASATGVPDNSVVSGLFSEPLDSTTVTTSTFELRGPGNVLIPATVRYDSTARAARLTPNVPLADSTVYMATLHGGATDPRLKDLAGNPLAANVTWSFTTIGDRSAPTVLATSPTAGATGVPDNVAVSGFFSEPLDSTTVTTATFELRGPGNTLISAQVHYDSTAHAARLTPNVPLADSTVYTATLHGGATDPRVKDLAGNPLAASVTWVFTTIGDRTPPTALAYTPAADSTGVPNSTVVRAVFSEPLDSTTVTSATFELRGPGNTLIAAQVHYDSTARAVVLIPTAPLADSTTYTATVHGGATDPRIKDLAGNPLAANVAWSFTTAAPTQVGVGPDVPRTLRISAAPNPARGSVRFSLEAPAGGYRDLQVLDVTGRLVRQLATGSTTPGRWTIAWDGRDSDGRIAAAGVYFARLRGPSHTVVTRIVRMQ
jgi:Domain of unknown function (DUF4082)/Bacterial Ig-like domain/Bacterial Ig domain/FlgD Ig-like domain